MEKKLIKLIFVKKRGVFQLQLFFSTGLSSVPELNVNIVRIAEVVVYIITLVT